MTRKKKRTKIYQGNDSAQLAPTVRRYSAVVRSPLGEWWHDHKKQLRFIGAAIGVALIVGYLIYELIKLIV